MPRRANKPANIFLEFGNKQQAAPSLPQLQQLRARHHHHHSCWAQKLQRLVPFVDLETQLMVASAGHLATDTSPLPLPTASTMASHNVITETGIKGTHRYR